MTNKTYDLLKWAAMIFFPAFITFYGAVAIAWGFPHTEAIMTTLTALGTLLGTCLGVSNINYKKQETAGDVDIASEV